MKGSYLKPLLLGFLLLSSPQLDPGISLMSLPEVEGTSENHF